MKAVDSGLAHVGKNCAFPRKSPETVVEHNRRFD